MTSVATRETSRATTRSSRRTTMLVALGMVLGLVVFSMLTLDDAEFADPLDPRNPGHDGAQALARVLERQGVEVLTARGQEALLDVDVDDGTTVAVTNPGELGASTLARLQEHSGDAGAVVMIGHHELLGGMFDLEPEPIADGLRRADCDEPLARGLVIRTEAGGGLDTAGCFGSDGSAVLVRRDALWLMTAPGSFSNEHVLDGDNAALALRLLGQRDRLVWYVADSADSAGSDGAGLSTLLPRWLEPGLYLLLAGTVAFLLWRGRRLGPLVTEPLPVVVRAAESTQSRGRIYRRTGDRQHAATILVRAARRRIADLLRLPRGVGTETLATAAAARVGRDEREVLGLLADPAVTKDSQLVELGRQLIELENEVRGS